MNKLEYQTYLHSEHWINKRKEFYKVNQAICSKCQSTKNLNLHHLTYARLGKELLTDLICLCETCHHDLHNAIKKTKPKVKKKVGKSSKVLCKNCKWFIFGYYCKKKKISAPYKPCKCRSYIHNASK
jgi:hypothetical protein